LKKIKSKQSSQNRLMKHVKKEISKFPHLTIHGEYISGYIPGGMYSLRISLDYTFSKKQLEFMFKKFNIYREYLLLLHLESFFSRAKFVGRRALPNTEKIYSNLYSFPIFYRGSVKEINEYLIDLKYFLHSLKE